jgi:prepilin-type processing-associated H-X9-DG protein
LGAKYGRWVDIYWKLNYLKENWDLVRCSSRGPVADQGGNNGFYTYGSRVNLDSTPSAYWSRAYTTLTYDNSNYRVYFLLLKKIRNHSTYFQIGDSFSGSPTAASYGYNICSVSMWTAGNNYFYMAHNGIMNAGFLDGHVGQIIGDQFFEAAAKTYTSHNWARYRDKNFAERSQYVIVP